MRYIYKYDLLKSDRFDTLVSSKSFWLVDVSDHTKMSL